MQVKLFNNIYNKKMNYITGQTITEIFLSVDSNNTPKVPATFSAVTFQDGTEISPDSVDFNLSLVDSHLGVYKFYFTPQISGTYQVYVNNQTTNTLYISDVYNVTNYSSTIYVGI